MEKLTKEKIEVLFAALRQSGAKMTNPPIEGKFPNITIKDGDWEFQTPTIKVLSKEGEYFIETKPGRFDWLVAALIKV